MRLLIITPIMLFTCGLFADLSVAEDDGNVVPRDPPSVVARWLEFHRNGKRDDASSLTTGEGPHRAKFFLPFKRDSGVRVERSLGNDRVAAVVTGVLRKSRDSEPVLLFWLERREGVWRIKRSNSFEKAVVDERLRGFFEAGDVRWHLQRDQLLGNWEAVPCRPPGGFGLACRTELQLNKDGRYRQLSWGPGGPDPAGVMAGKWRIVDGKLVMSYQGRTFESIVTWSSGDQFAIESEDGKVRAIYDRCTDSTLAESGANDPLRIGNP